jgi:hypothetical protein
MGPAAGGGYSRLPGSCGQVALEGALDMYKLDNSRYPNTEQGLQALVTAPAVEPHAVTSACRPCSVFG